MTWRGSRRGCYDFDSCFGLGLGSAGNVDFRAFGVQYFGDFETDTIAATGYDEDFAGLRGDVFFSEGWCGWEHLGVDVADY